MTTAMVREILQGITTSLFFISCVFCGVCSCSFRQFGLELFFVMFSCFLLFFTTCFLADTTLVLVSLFGEEKYTAAA